MCLVGFASIAIVVVCGRCVLHRLFATTCKHPCLKPLGTHAKASLPCSPLPLHQSLLFPLIFAKEHLSLALLAPAVTPSLSIPTTFAKAHQPLRPAPRPCLPSKKVRCCHPKKFGRLPEGLLPIRTINEIFRTTPSTKLASPVKGRWLAGKAQA